MKPTSTLYVTFIEILITCSQLDALEDKREAHVLLLWCRKR